MRENGRYLLGKDEVVVFVPKNASARSAGWLGVTMTLLLLMLLAVRMVSWGYTYTMLRIMPAYLALVALGVICILNLYRAIGNNFWIVGPNSFKIGRKLRKNERAKSYVLSTWEVRQDGDSSRYVLVPVGEKLPFNLFGLRDELFYPSENSEELLKLGRELAQLTGWPLQIPDRLLQPEQLKLQGKL